MSRGPDVGVSDDMLQAALDAYDVRGWGQVLWTPREAMRQAIKAAIRERRADLRLVTAPDTIGDRSKI